MKSLWKRALVTGTAGIALAGGVGLATASPAAAAEGNVLQCNTWIADNVAYGNCYNPGTQLHAFSVRAICGWSADAYSNWVYVTPGTSSSIGIGCGAPWSTGVGGVAIEYGG
ncbi:hypothetical protein [Streptomyces sp. HD]|uniref:hypothetical protein n=1 Tax=Streptomyces sp. HD TaxID=3020892 RepID=UPI00068ECB3F|nr:hypothetical protein [Streptomyces sp. HD]MDC0768497.1 hypothetical protein [Streptomyces sp. HD]